MSLESKIIQVVSAIGLDIKSLKNPNSLFVDTTGILAIAPIRFVHNNQFSNAASYLSGTSLFEALYQNNNQPILVSRKKVNSATYGNSANFIIQNLGGDITAGSIFASDFELLANNYLINAYNGKGEVGICSGSSASGEEGDGWIYVALRRDEHHPSGANTGFDPVIKIHNHKYGAHFRHLGSKMGIYPVYDVGIPASFNILTPFNDAIFSAQSTYAGGNAELDLYSGSSGNASVGGHYKIRAVGSSNRLAFINKSAGNSTIAEFLDTSGNNMFCVYGTDVTTGQQRYGNSTHNMIIKAIAKEFDFTSLGNTLLKTNGTYYLKNMEQVGITPTSGGTSIITFNALETHIYFNSSTLIDTYTITLGTPLKDGQEIIIHTRQGGCTNFVLNSTDNTAVLYNIPTALAPKQKINLKYRTSGNAWW